MIKRLILAASFGFFLVLPAMAQEEDKADDTISYDIYAEDWVTTKTARVLLGVEAAVSDQNSGSMRADMAKAVNAAAKADWRMTNFYRSQDKTGLERWSLLFEARLSEADLGGLADDAKKASKAGMQVRVENIDFSPSREEVETARAALRVRIYKDVAEQLKELNAALPGRSYRISQIAFEHDMPMPNALFRVGKAMAEMASAPNDGMSGGMGVGQQEVSQKILVRANVIFASDPSRGSK
ncbi:MAG: hypothetical protein PHE27_09360 [Alphaproteobacteria bacterium]|nr:hypothetical protein [Alphaproteobacteria bacterium]